jgi:Chaperone of endosialidase
MSGIFGAGAPEPPNPATTASAQTSTNISTAIANAFLNNANQRTPTGSLTYTPSGDSVTLNDPANAGVQYTIPRFLATQTLNEPYLSTEQQRAQAQLGLASLANTQANRVQGLLSGGVDLGQAPPAAQANLLSTLPMAETGFGDAGNLTRDYAADDQQRARVEQAMFQRAQPQLDLQQEQLRQQLADQGIRYGSPAYTAAMDNFNRQVNDFRLGVIQAGGQEQQLQAGLAQQRATFQNTAQQAAYQQALGRGTFTNAGLAQQQQRVQALQAAQERQRNQYLAEQYALRNQPLNEINALLSGSQVSQQPWATYNQSQIPTTDIAGLINQQFAQQFGNYQAQTQAQSQLLGGVLGAAGNVGLGLALSDRRAKENIHRIGTVFATEDYAGEESDRKKLPIYKYSYKGDPSSTTHTGPMAQDVEKIDPSAVMKDRHGVKYLNVPKTMGSILRAA